LSPQHCDSEISTALDLCESSMFYSLLYIKDKRRLVELKEIYVVYNLSWSQFQQVQYFKKNIQNLKKN